MLQIEIVTPEGCVYSDTADSITLPTAMGEIGIFPGHIPLITQIIAGELVIRQSGKLTDLIIGEGFAQVENNKVSVLAEHAIDEAEIDAHAVEQAMASAQETLKNTDAMDPAEVERTEKLLRFMDAQLRKRAGTKRQ